MDWKLTLLTAVVTMHLADAATPVGEMTLRDLRWKKRVILVSAAAGESQKVELQKRLFSEVKTEAEERDLVLVELVKTDLATRKKFQIPDDQFTVLLIGKDGGEKARSDQPVNVRKWMALIDSMPMRQDEIRDREKR